MLFVGIDPGVSGGIAAIHASISNPAPVVVTTMKMPETDRDILDALEFIKSEACRLGASTLAVIEKVHASPQMGVVSAFTFGGGVRALRMALTAARIPFDQVTPQRWQKALGCSAGASRAGGGAGGNKNITKSRAQALFPDIKITHAIADALLLAEYSRRYHLRLTDDVPLVADGSLDIPGRPKTRNERRDSGESHGEAKGREGGEKDGEKEGRQGRQGGEVRKGARRRSDRAKGARRVSGF